MRILSHRGYWQAPEEKNQLVAFSRSFDLGFGCETDLRDCGGELVISHDMATGGEMTFEELLQLMDGRNLPLALNIKADGLAGRMLELLNQYGHTNYFTFDMSIPEMVKQVGMQLKVYAPLSDVNQTPVLLEKSSGVWLDGFYSIWYDNQVIEELIGRNLEVCIVSSELHGRSYEKQWGDLKSNKFISSSELLLCTDRPEEASGYFA
jgi:glycerophosphoryl diester phosphodiesterase